MDQVVGWLVKLLFIVILAPFVICLAVQLVVGLAVAILPLVILASAIAGLVAGVSAALVLRRRLPPPRRTAPLAGGSLAGQQRIRRPKGGRGLGEE
jgi:hypothetical protein